MHVVLALTFIANLVLFTTIKWELNISGGNKEEFQQKEGNLCEINDCNS